MTGEWDLPAETVEGDTVVGGTVVLTGRLVVRASRVGADTQLAQLVRLVEQAQAQRPPNAGAGRPDQRSVRARPCGPARR